MFISRPFSILKESMDLSDASYNLIWTIDRIAYVAGVHGAMLVFAARAWIVYFDIAWSKALEEGSHSSRLSLSLSPSLSPHVFVAHCVRPYVTKHIFHGPYKSDGALQSELARV